MNRFRIIATLSATLFGGLASASASLLAPGAMAAPDILSPSSASTIVAGEAGSTMAATFTDGYIATVMSDPNNVFCAGCLDFTYTFANNGPGVNERFSAYNFAGFQTDVGYVGTKGLNVNPTTVDRSGDGSVIGFNYFPGTNLVSGNTTSILIIETDALFFTTGTFTIQDGSTSTLTGWAPAPSPTTLSAEAPEPASLALFGTGLIGAVAFLQRKRKDAAATTLL